MHRRQESVVAGGLKQLHKSLSFYINCNKLSHHLTTKYTSWPNRLIIARRETYNPTACSNIGQLISLLYMCNRRKRNYGQTGI